MKHRFRLSIKKKKIVVLLSVITLILVILSAVGSYVFNYLNYQTPVSALYLKLFDLNTEGNLPTLFSTLILMFASVLLALIFIKKKISRSPDRHYWLFLSVVFLLLAMDESLQIHEKVTNMINLIGDEGNITAIQERPAYLRYVWVIPYSVLVIGLGLFLFNFLFRLPAKTRNLFILSGAIFVSGAIGLEFLEAYYDSLYGANLYTVVLYTVEEGMEMAGVVIFIYALLAYLSENQDRVRITFQQKFKNKKVGHLHN